MPSLRNNRLRRLTNRACIALKHYLVNQDFSTIMVSNTTYQQFLQTAFNSGLWSTDEVADFVLPLFEEILSFHERGMVGSFEKPDTVTITNGVLDIDEEAAHYPLQNISAVKKLLSYQQVAGYNITERLMVDDDLSGGTRDVTNLQVSQNPQEELKMPVYLPGFQCYEMKLGHHDAQSDIFCLGLILGSAIMGLDLYDPQDLNEFAAYRDQPAGINARMHPTLCALVTEMTELDRHVRSRDLHDIIQRIKHYRDYDPQREEDLSKLAAFQVKKASDRKSFILSKLRNRLFDTSRRNRLLYYKPNARFVNLTVSSVPMVLHYQSIKPNLLFTWNDEIANLVVGQKDISLNKYLRFEDHPYLNAQLNGIRQLAENDRKEFGFSHLKLVVAFLHWHNLKENEKERIQSPLLLIPVELERKKSLKDERFAVKIIDNAALINPILANYLKDLYGIELPESVDFDEVSMRDFFRMLEAKISAARQGVKLNYVDKPRIRIIHSIARQTINNYRKRLKLKSTPGFQHMDYSYSEENFKPLGLEIFRQKVEPRQSSLEFLLSDNPSTSYPQSFAATEKSSFELAEAENNPYSWDFDVCNIVLGNFNYKKMSLVSDYNKVLDNSIDHPVFNELFSNEPRNNEDSVVNSNPADWYHVITADPTQARAVLHSRSGKSYIIQGPPGTGKSQTITNLVADFLAQGKSVLFVCEKRAALDVVYHRLQQNKLAELCSYIHDSQGDKKEFYRDIKTVYEDFLQNRVDADDIAAKRNNEIQQLIRNLELLQSYHRFQQNIHPDAGLSTRRLVEKLIGLKAHLPAPGKNENDAIPHYQHWLSYGDTLLQLGRALEASGADTVLANHPFSNLGIDVVKAENPFTLIDSLVNHASSALKDLSAIIAKNAIPPTHTRSLEHVKNLIQDSVLLSPLAETRNLQLVDLKNQESREFEETFRQYKETQEAYKKSAGNNHRWQNKLDRQELQTAIEMAAKHEKSFFSFLSGSWRRLKKQLGQSYDFASHQVKPAFSQVLQQLQDEYQKEDLANNQRSSLEKKYHLSNIDKVYLGIDVLRRKQGDKEIDYLLQHPDSNDLVLQLSRTNNLLQQLELQLKQCLYAYQEKSINQVQDELATIRMNTDALKDLLPELRKFSELPRPVQEFIRRLPITPVQAEAVMAQKTFQSLLDNNQGFASTNQAMIAETVRNIDKHYKALLHVNAEYIRAVRRRRFLQHYEISNTSVTVLNDEQRRLKKEYTDGRRILEREMGKTMRYRSIREIASGESGIVLKDLKPVWLMSPLSVSDSLPLDRAFFDVVIFDEASQIALEEGIPALFRAPQTIIVGDEKQMPPSNFFMARAEDPEDLETIEGEQEDEILSMDADSLLVQGSRKLGSTMLSWHYRSRYETLISYSNHAFYSAGLLTIPDKTIHHQEKPLLEVKEPSEGAKHSGFLLNDSISFHYLPNSVYEARGNISEAKYIAQLVKQLLTDGVQETIGVVAFSQEQQGVIEEEINALAAADKQMEVLLENAYNRNDEGQFTGLFIKNLENVQGDERDIIIMSVCYGPDSNRKMLMNFGPINRKGGEKRLNVIFSRAKKHMAVVSSIRHFNITNDYNDGANYFKRFLHYAELVSTGSMIAANTILESLLTQKQKEQYHRVELTTTRSQVKKALETSGYLVDENVGQSSFKCSLAIRKNAQDSQYKLGILVDDDLHYKNDDLIELYFQRPAILEAFGWKLTTVFAKDWLEDSQRVLNKLVQLVEQKSEPVKEVQPVKTEESLPLITVAVNTNKTRMVSAAGDLFWEVELQGYQLFLRFGKMGTNGQAQVKSFDSEEEAKTNKDELIRQQREKGFLHISNS